MEMTPETATSAAQIIAVLLVATMLDPWAKNTATSGSGTRRRVRIGATISYIAKVLTVVVLLGNMQVILFDQTWEGARGAALALGNYVAVTFCGLSILLAVLSHLGAFKGHHSDAEGAGD